jgi:hypothetical protein
MNWHWVVPSSGSRLHAGHAVLRELEGLGVFQQELRGADAEMILQPQNTEFTKHFQFSSSTKFLSAR